MVYSSPFKKTKKTKKAKAGKASELLATSNSSQALSDVSLDDRIKHFRQRLAEGDPCQHEILTLMEKYSKDERVFQISKQSAKVFAEQLRILDAQVFLNWDKEELYNSDIYKSESELIKKHGGAIAIGKGFYAGIQSSKDVLNHANQIADSVTQNILSFADIHARTAALDYWIRVAYRLTQKEPFDFLGAAQIYAALNKAEILRLKNTFNGLPQKTQSKLKEMEQLFDPSNHFRNYKDALEKNSTQALIPNPTLIFQEPAPLHETYSKNPIYKLRDQIKAIDLQLESKELTPEKKASLLSDKTQLEKQFQEQITPEQTEEITRLDQLESALSQAKAKLTHLDTQTDSTTIAALCKNIQLIETKIKILESENFSEPFSKIISENKKIENQLASFSNKNPGTPNTLLKSTESKPQDDATPQPQKSEKEQSDDRFNRSLAIEPRNQILDNPMKNRLRSTAVSLAKRARKRVLSGSAERSKSAAQEAAAQTDPKQKASDLATQLKSNIGNYDTGKNSAAEVKQTLGQEGYQILTQGAYASNSHQSARTAFIDYLSQVLYDTQTDLKKISETPLDNTIKIKNLLGEKGLDLYLKAIEEEKNSIEFRQAVLLKSKTFYPGPKWAERIVLWVAGPSAAGKTASSGEILNLLNLELPKQVGINTGNTVIAIDGEIEREVSQVSRLLLQVALQKGYAGIRDQHTHTQLDVKSQIQKATEKNRDIHLLIPDTFADPTHLREIGKYNKLPNTREIFSEVIADTDEKGKPDAKKDAAFQATVVNNGESRAFEKKPKTQPIGNRHLVMNHAPIHINSKIYQKQYFEFGKNGSGIARKMYHMGSNPYYIPVRNDFIFVKQNQNQWMECNPKEKEALHLSKRHFELFQSEKKSGITALDLPAWLDQLKSKKEFYPAPLVDLTLDRFNAFMQSIQDRFRKNDACYSDLSPLMARLPKNPSVRESLQKAWGLSILIKARQFREHSQSLSQSENTQALSLYEKQLDAIVQRDFLPCTDSKEREVKLAYWIQVIKTLYQNTPHDLMSAHMLFKTLNSDTLNLNAHFSELAPSVQSLFKEMEHLFSDQNQFKPYQDFLSTLPPNSVVIPSLLVSKNIAAAKKDLPQAKEAPKDQAANKPTASVKAPDSHPTSALDQTKINIAETIAQLHTKNSELENQFQILKKQSESARLFNQTQEKIHGFIQKQKEVLSKKTTLQAQSEGLILEAKILLEVDGSEQRQADIISALKNNQGKNNQLDTVFDFYQKQIENQERLQETILKSQKNINPNTLQADLENTVNQIKKNNDHIVELEKQLETMEKQVDVDALTQLEESMNALGFEFEEQLDGMDKQAALDEFTQLEKSMQNVSFDFELDQAEEKPHLQKTSIAHIEKELFHEHALDELNTMGDSLKKSQREEKSASKDNQNQAIPKTDVSLKSQEQPSVPQDHEDKSENKNEDKHMRPRLGS